MLQIIGINEYLDTFHAVTVIKSSELLVLRQKQYIISLAFCIKQSYKN